MRAGDVLQFLVERQRVGAQRVHRAPRLGQAVGGHPLRGREHVECLVDVAAVGQHGARGLDLDTETAERMREHVVDLPRDPGALVEHIRAPLLDLQLSCSYQQFSGLLGLHSVRAPLSPDQQAASDRDRVPDQLGGVPAERERTDQRAQDPDPDHGERRPGRGVGTGRQRGDGGE